MAELAQVKWSLAIILMVIIVIILNLALVRTRIGLSSRTHQMNSHFY